MFVNHRPEGWTTPSVSERLIVSSQGKFAVLFKEEIDSNSASGPLWEASHLGLKSKEGEDVLWIAQGAPVRYVAKQTVDGKAVMIVFHRSGPEKTFSNMNKGPQVHVFVGTEVGTKPQKRPYYEFGKGSPEKHVSLDDEEVASMREDVLASLRPVKPGALPPKVEALSLTTPRARTQDSEVTTASISSSSGRGSKKPKRKNQGIVNDPFRRVGELTVALTQIEQEEEALRQKKQALELERGYLVAQMKK